VSGVAFEEAACYICHVSDGALWAEENGFRMTKCGGCGLVQLNLRPSLAETDEAATTGPHKFGAGPLNAVGSHSPRKVRECTAKLRALLPESAWGDSEMSWPDIGAGFGELVEAVRRGQPPWLPRATPGETGSPPKHARKGHHRAAQRNEEGAREIAKTRKEDV